MISRFSETLLVALVALLLSTNSLAENMFDDNSGNLIIPEIQVNDNLAYSASFNLVSRNPLVWAIESAQETTANSRTAASYDSVSALIRVPEITFQGRLYNLSFQISNNCDASFCLEPDLASLAYVGRSGADIFTNIASSDSTFSCASCHAMSEENSFASDGIRRPGHPLANATRRPHFKNAELGNMLDAVNTCLTEWMNTTPWVESDLDWINLFNWFDDLADETTADPVVIDIVTTEEAVDGGSAEAGRTLFNTSCIVCHGQDGTGTLLAPKITEIGLQADYIQRRVRTSGRIDSNVYQNLSGGVMPFWAADRLSNGELADIVAFVSSDTVDPLITEGGSITGGSTTGGSTTEPSTCSSNNVKVGQSLTFNGKFHSVSGVATILDDCTIELTNFNYDGGGVDVHIYAGRNSRFLSSQGGFSLLAGLLGTRYVNATLRITLPRSVSLDDFDSLSVWCVPVGVSFGDGQFS